jgi:hypothetical protein
LNGKISIWVPYAAILAEILPSNKGTDMRVAKRTFSLLNILPIIKSHLRPKLICANEKSIIATLDDFREVLAMTQNVEGIPSYKMSFYINIFYPCYDLKKEPDMSKDGTRQENIIAVTTRDPIIERQSISKSIPFISKSSGFDKDLQPPKMILPKNCKEISPNWLIIEILSLLSYRGDLDNYHGPLGDLVNRELQFQDKDGKSLSVKEFCSYYEYTSCLTRYVSSSKTSSSHSKYFGEIQLLPTNVKKK